MEKLQEASFNYCEKASDTDEMYDAFRAGVLWEREQPKECFIIMHQKKIYNNKIFFDYKEARNYIFMQNTKRTFKEVSEDEFKDVRYGATFYIQKLVS